MPINPISEPVLCPLFGEMFSPISLGEEFVEHFSSKYRNDITAPSPDSSSDHECYSSENSEDSHDKTVFPTTIDSFRNSLAPLTPHTCLGQHIRQGLVDPGTMPLSNGSVPSSSIGIRQKNMPQATSYDDYVNKLGDDRDVLRKLLFYE